MVSLFLALTYLQNFPTSKLNGRHVFQHFKNVPRRRVAPEISDLRLQMLQDDIPALEYIGSDCIFHKI